MKDCIFCKIIGGEIPGSFVHQSEDVVAIRDIHPQAPVHILVMPRAHVLESAADITEKHSALMGKLFAAAAEIARQEGLDTGWRLITNVGRDGGQSVNHLHFHLLGGRPLGETII